MKNTEINKTPNNTLTDYAKSNIDVHINWLLFLNSFNSISNQKGFVEVAPILETIKKEAYENLKDITLLNHTDFINSQIINIIGDLLDKYDLTDAKEHIGESISSDDVINLSTALFIRKRLENVEMTEVPKDHAIKFITTIIKTIKYESLKVSLNIDGYSHSLLGYFLESLGIKYNELATIQNYIYQIMELTKGIELMANRVLDESNTVISESNELIIYQLIDCNHIESIYEVDKIFNQLNDILNKLAKEDIVTLKKQI